MALFRRGLKTSLSRAVKGRWENARHFSVAADAQLEPEEFKVEKLTGENEGIVLFTMDRPASRNALGRTMMKQFSRALDAVRFDNSVRAVVLQSNVEKVFCAGADLRERVKMSPPEVAAFVHGLRTSFTSLEHLPMPTIACIEGAALGGGLEMALACDFRIAGGNAVLGVPETSLAIIPGAGGTQRLPRLIGTAKAKELIFTARRIGPQMAENLGLIDYAVDAGNALERSLTLAREILPQGPIAIRMAKKAVNMGMQVDISTGMVIEEGCYAQVIPTKDRVEGLTAFREKRKPVYKGE